VQYNQLVELGQDKKMIAATEVGAAPLPDLLQAYQVHWLWFAVWSDGFINNAEWNSLETLQTVSILRRKQARRKSFNANNTQIYNHDYVLTLDEIQGWRNSA
jgi:Glycosyl hydrolase family 26.